MDQGRIMQLIAPQIKNRPDYPALTSGDGRSITYHQLHEAVSFLTEELNSRGIELKQRVAVIMDNGIDMALCALAVSSIAALVPLSPDFSEEQYRFYMELLKIDYLLTGISNSICIKIAGELNIPVFKLIKSIAGNEYKYQLTGEAAAAKPLIPAQNDDIAMILYTSGTTSIPKIVPRTQENIVASTQKRLIEMGLNSADSVLFTFPLDRGISLNDTITTLAAGGTVIYAESLQPETIFKSIEVSKPSWILGTPVIFHALADYGEKTNKSINNSNLRTIRASGAPLTSELALRLNKLFGVPVYMGYGMTETGNICSTQNSPRGIKAGSAGVPDITDVSIMDENGQEIGNNVEGEIVVRGPQVIKAYENSADVNEASFHGEWFRTGDSGYIDEDGYLFIIGRYKEIINRGGEKVSPYEVEEAISAHPLVEQAAVFPIPAGEGPEEVGAAVVLKEGAQLYLKELRRFLKGRITAFKMPSVLYVLEELPVSDAGKIQRKKLYENIIELGIKAQSFTGDNEIIIRPRNETEEKLYEIFKKILPPGNFSITDSFFELGGDSLKTAVLFENIEKNFGVQVPLKLIFSNGSIEKLADYIINHQEEEEFIPFIVPFNTEGEKAPIFFIHASEGEAVVYKNIAMGFDAERPFYGISFDPHGADWTHPLTFEQIAAEYAQAIAAMQPRGPYLLAGQCVGGIIAYETARQLGLADQQAEMLAMFDPIVPGTEDAITFKTRVKNNIKELNEQGWGQYFKTKKYYYKHRLQILLYKTVPLKLKPLVFRYIDKESWIRYGRSIYEIKPYNGEIIYLKPENTPGKSSDRSIAIWSQMAEAIKVIDLEGEHDSVLFAEHADNTRRVLEGLLENIKQERRVY
jgi:acyl-CoA synthetase (AMP-forming)/AMP-acid ligase II/thioesterase domain-containing protein/acyl carrier protein